MKWKSIDINKNLIKVQTGSAVLVAMPHSTRYDGFRFWFPEKLIWKSKRSDCIELHYNNDFTFRLKKYGQGRYNQYDVVKEIEISCKEFEEIMSNALPWIDYGEEPKPLLHKPERIVPEPTEAIEDLIDDE